jgi:hypothetical protein
MGWDGSLHVSHWMDYCSSPGWRWWVWSSRWNEWQKKSKNSENTCPSAIMSTTNPPWPDLCSNSGRSGEKPATNRLSYGLDIYVCVCVCECSSKIIPVLNYLSTMPKTCGFLTSEVVGGELPAWRSVRITPWERVHGTHWRGGLVVLKVSLDDMEKWKIPNPKGIACRQSYTGYATPVPCIKIVSILIYEKGCMLVHIFFLQSTGGIPGSRTPASGVILDRFLESWRIGPMQDLYPQTANTNTWRKPIFILRDGFEPTVPTTEVSTRLRSPSENDRLPYSIT